MPPKDKQALYVSSSGLPEGKHCDAIVLAHTLDGFLDQHLYDFDLEDCHLLEPVTIPNDLPLFSGMTFVSQELERMLKWNPPLVTSTP
jgi:hypothetical protein